MKLPLLLLLLSTPAFALAQQQTQADQQVQRTAKRNADVFAQPVNCPVAFTAQVNARAIARSIEDEKKFGNAPLLEMTFRPQQTTAIVAATLTVHGLSADSRYLPAVPAPRTTQDRTQTFKLAATEDTHTLTAAQVHVTKMLVIRYAELTALTYADGTTWHSTPETRCTAHPSNLKLIAASTR